MSEIPIPLLNYVNLIKNRQSPYYDIAQYIVDDMEEYYSRSGNEYEIVYTVNPRLLRQRIKEKISNINEKVTTVNICRIILALLYGSNLDEKKDFYVTTTSCGRKNYHVRVNGRTLNWLSSLL